MRATMRLWQTEILQVYLLLCCVEVHRDAGGASELCVHIYMSVHCHCRSPELRGLWVSVLPPWPASSVTTSTRQCREWLVIDSLCGISFYSSYVNVEEA